MAHLKREGTPMSDIDLSRWTEAERMGEEARKLRFEAMRWQDAYVDLVVDLACKILCSKRQVTLLEPKAMKKLPLPLIRAAIEDGRLRVERKQDGLDIICEDGLPLRAAEQI